MDLFKTEKQKLKHGYSLVIGCDEVGRGCLAGPVVAGAVVFNLEALNLKPEAWMREIKDSKLLTPEKRSVLDRLIRQQAVAWGIGLVAPSVIDKINIHQASLLAMHRAVTKLHAQLRVSHATQKNTFVMVDGKFSIPKLAFEQQAIIGGDAKVFSISAASIIAKVYRDNLMMKLHRKFPSYGFAQHKGYATVQHRAAIKQHGLTAIHRESFCTKVLAL